MGEGREKVLRHPLQQENGPLRTEPPGRLGQTLLQRAAGDAGGDKDPGRIRHAAVGLWHIEGPAPAGQRLPQLGHRPLQHGKRPSFKGAVHPVKSPCGALTQDLLTEGRGLSPAVKALAVQRQQTTPGGHGQIGPEQVGAAPAR